MFSVADGLTWKSVISVGTGIQNTSPTVSGTATLTCDRSRQYMILDPVCASPVFFAGPIWDH